MYWIVAKVSASSLEQFNPAYSIFSLPYVFQSTEHYFGRMMRAGQYKDSFSNPHMTRDFAIGWCMIRSAFHLYHQRGTAESPADLKGLKSGPRTALLH
ncbi:MAG: hypothetical protein ACLTW9_24025 [Enterocloster sp.]